MSSQIEKARTEHLGDEAFMSASDLRSYISEMQMAQATSELKAMDKAEKARQELVKSLSQPSDLTPEVQLSLVKRLVSNIKSAAQRGESEIMVMRFPNTLCTDKGRAINNAEDGWPDTLTGRPRQAFEFWRDQIRPQGYGLKAMIIEWPAGLPGDVGFFLSWKQAKS